MVCVTNHTTQGLESPLGIHGKLVPGPPADTQILPCSNSLYKMAKYSRPSVSVGSTTANSLRLVERAVAEPVGTRAHCSYKGVLSPH